MLTTQPRRSIQHFLNQSPNNGLFFITKMLFIRKINLLADEGGNGQKKILWAWIQVDVSGARPSSRPNVYIPFTVTLPKKFTGKPTRITSFKRHSRCVPNYHFVMEETLARTFCLVCLRNCRIHKTLKQVSSDKYPELCDTVKIKWEVRQKACQTQQQLMAV